MLADLKKGVEKIENDETRFEIIECLEPLEKINDRKLKNSLFIAEGIIDRAKKLVGEYKTQNGLDEKAKKSILTEIEKIRSYCKEYDR